MDLLIKTLFLITIFFMGQHLLTREQVIRDYKQMLDEHQKKDEAHEKSDEEQLTKLYSLIEELKNKK